MKLYIVIPISFQQVVSLINLDLAETRSAIHAFTEALTEGSYALFYFSGHGFASPSGQTFLIPQTAPANYKEEDCICVQEILEVRGRFYS